MGFLFFFLFWPWLIFRWSRVHETPEGRKAIRWKAWLNSTMKGATSSRMLWRGASNHWTRDTRMRLRIYSERRDNAGNWSILVPAGKEINWDAVSKSDWNRRKANWICYSNMAEMWCYRLSFSPIFVTWSLLESNAKEGDSPVKEAKRSLTDSRVA